MIALFDFDGTIAETGPTVSECLALSIEKTLGRRPDAAALGRAMGSGAVLAGLFEQLVGTVSAGTMATLVDDYLAFYPDVDKRLTQLYDGVGEALDALRAAGIGLAIVTNKQTLPTKQSLAHFRLEEYFPLVIGAEAGLAGKPQAASFHQRIAPHYHGLAPQDFVMIGDTATDIRFAKASGLASIWVSYGHGDAALCAGLLPDATAADMKSVARLVLTMRDRASPEATGLITAK